MIKATIEAGKMRGVMDIVSAVVDEAKFALNPKELVIRAVNESRILVVEMKLKKKAFKEFEIEDCNLGIDVKKFKKSLALASGDVKISSKGKKLKLEYNNVVREIPLLTIEGLSDPKLPKLKFGAKLKLKKKEIDVGIKTFENIGNEVVISAKEGVFEMSVSDLGDSAKITLSDDLIDEMDCLEEINSTYSLEYLTQLIKVVGNEIEIQMGTNFPMRIDFDIADGDGHVTFMLAPRIEDDE